MSTFLIISKKKMLSKRKTIAIRVTMNIQIMMSQEMITMILKMKTAIMRTQVRITNLIEKMKIRMKMKDLKRMILKLRNRQRISKTY